MHNRGTTKPPSLLCLWGNIPEAWRQINCFSWEMRWQNTSCPEDPLQILLWAKQTFHPLWAAFPEAGDCPQHCQEVLLAPWAYEIWKRPPMSHWIQPHSLFVVFLSLRKPWQQQGSAEHSDFSLSTVALACYLQLEIWFGKASTIPPIWKKKQ